MVQTEFFSYWSFISPLLVPTHINARHQYQDGISGQNQETLSERWGEKGGILCGATPSHVGLLTVTTTWRSTQEFTTTWRSTHSSSHKGQTSGRREALRHRLTGRLRGAGSLRWKTSPWSPPKIILFHHKLINGRRLIVENIPQTSSLVWALGLVGRTVGGWCPSPAVAVGIANVHINLEACVWISDRLIYRLADIIGR